MNFFSQILQAIMDGYNPVQILLGILSNNLPNNNPIYQNLSSMIQNKDEKGLEAFARNLAHEKGVDFDTEFANFRRNLNA